MDKLLNSRPFAIAAIVLCGLVLLVSVCGIVGVWVTNSIASNFVIDVSVGIESSAQAVQRGVLRLDTGIEELRAEVQQVSQAVTQVSQNVGDEGLVRTLLPEATEERLTTAVTRVTDTTGAIRDSLSAARNLYRSVNRIPGVNLPTPSEEVTQNVTARAEEVRADVQELRSAIAGVRAQQADAIERVNVITSRIDTRLSTTQDNLNQINAGLTNVQTAAQQVRRTVPTLFAIGAAIITLIQLWVIATQVIVIRMMWHTLRKEPQAHEPPPPSPAAPSEPPAEPPSKPIEMPPATVPGIVP